ALVREQELLARHPTAVAGERTARADHPVTGHDDGNRIRRIGAADGARRAWSADAARQLRVADRRAVRDAQKRVPDFALERGTARPELQLEGAPAAVEVLLELPRDVLAGVRLPLYVRLRSGVAPREVVERRAVGERECHERTLLVQQSQHLAHGRGDAACSDPHGESPSEVQKWNVASVRWGANASMSRRVATASGLASRRKNRSSAVARPLSPAGTQSANPKPRISMYCADHGPRPRTSRSRRSAAVAGPAASASRSRSPTAIARAV